MNDENTTFDNENIQYQSQQQENNNISSEAVDNKNVPNKKPMWQRAAIGAGTGFAAGVAATLFTSGTTQAQAQEQELEQGQATTETTDHPAWVDGEISVASSVNDDMSFGQAFAAARAEIGPGGVFEWHGGIYNTYYEGEWASMSAAERADFGSHFSWSDSHNGHAASHQTHIASDEVTVTSVEHPGSGGVKPVSIDEPVTTETDHEVEILGVVHDDSGVNIGGMMIDGHEAVVLDVDGDMTFDIIGVDMNDNHEFEDNELGDISDAGITVDHLGGLSEPDMDQASDESIPDTGSYEC